MPNHVWQAEEKKWEKKLFRAQQALAHIRELRRLEAEEEEEERPALAPAGQVQPPAGQVVGLAGQPAALLPPSPKAKEVGASEKTKPTAPKRTARETVPELLRDRGAMTVKALADTLELSNQAVANALANLKGEGVVVEEPSTFRGFRLQYRLAEDVERVFRSIARDLETPQRGGG